MSGLDIVGLVLTCGNRVFGGTVWALGLAATVGLSKLTEQNITRLHSISFNIAEWKFPNYGNLLRGYTS
jgi:hypothetical protein